MYYIAVYDVNSERVAKALRIMRKYLHWVQNSVFEGELTTKQLLSLQRELKTSLDLEEDSVIFYETQNQKFVNRLTMGVEKNLIDNFI